MKRKWSDNFLWVWSYSDCRFEGEINSDGKRTSFHEVRNYIPEDKNDFKILTISFTIK